MLILTRKLGESINIGNNIKVQVVDIKGKQVKIGIEAPKDTVVLREELYLKIKSQNEKAADTAPKDLSIINSNFRRWNPYGDKS